MPDLQKRTSSIPTELHLRTAMVSVTVELNILQGIHYLCIPDLLLAGLGGLRSRLSSLRHSCFLSRQVAWATNAGRLRPQLYNSTQCQQGSATVTP
jgi:hypothetical protein